MLVVVKGRPDERMAALETGDATERTRIVVLRATSDRGHAFGEPSLSKISDFIIESSPDSISVVLDSSGECVLLRPGHLRLNQTKGELKVFQVDEDGTIQVLNASHAQPNVPAHQTPEVPRALPLTETITAFMSRSDQTLEHS